MEPKLIRISDSIIINPAHVALAVHEGHGVISLHFALARAERLGDREPVPGHVVLSLAGAEAAAAWAGLNQQAR